MGKRIDRAGYLLFIPLFAVFAYYSREAPRWFTAIALFVLLVIVLELGWRLSEARRP